MTDISSLLESQASDMVEVDTPDGTWKVKAVSARFEETRDDKNGKPFTQARFIMKPVEAQEDVEADELAAFEDADGFNEATLFHYFGPIYGKGEMARLRRLVESSGVSITGLTNEEMLAEVDGNQEFFAEVKHVVDKNGENRVRVEKIYAAVS